MVAGSRRGLCRGVDGFHHLRDERRNGTCYRGLIREVWGMVSHIRGKKMMGTSPFPSHLFLLYHRESGFYYLFTTSPDLSVHGATTQGEGQLRSLGMPYRADGG